MNRNALTLTIAALVALTGASANASLIGDDVTLNISHTNFPNAGDAAGLPQTATVSGGVEFALFTVILIDVSDSDILLTYNANAGGIFTTDPDEFITYELTDLDWLPDAGEIVGYEITLNTFAAGRVAVSFTSDSVWITLNEGSFNFDSVNIHLITSHVETPAVPEPATMTLLGLGLAGLAYRKRKHSA